MNWSRSAESSRTVECRRHHIGFSILNRDCKLRIRKGYVPGQLMRPSTRSSHSPNKFESSPLLRFPVIVHYAAFFASPPFSMMKFAIDSTPSPLFKFEKTKGLFPRILSVSASITPRFAPTRGARSILLIKSRRARFGRLSDSLGLSVAGKMRPPWRRRTNF